MPFPTLGPSSLPAVVTQPDERHANRTASVLEWYDRHRAYIQHLVQTKNKREAKCNLLIARHLLLFSTDLRLCSSAEAGIILNLFLKFEQN